MELRPDGRAEPRTKESTVLVTVFVWDAPRLRVCGGALSTLLSSAVFRRVGRIAKSDH
jgi:hypothetical protein